MHDRPPPHTVPQPPQLVASLLMSTQLPLQLTSGAVHDVAQLPALHTWFMPQALAQEPQLAGSADRSTQALPHFVRPTPHTHCAALQI